jgi:Pyruvate/2-oxoacid:ferredoxin oxidoreductase delta subunit
MKHYTLKIKFINEKDCVECPLCKSDDNCILQDEDFDSFYDQIKGCPLVEVEEEQSDYSKREQEYLRGQFLQRYGVK